jgi:hypothetical protein
MTNDECRIPKVGETAQNPQKTTYFSKKLTKTAYIMTKNSVNQAIS